MLYLPWVKSVNNKWLKLSDLDYAQIQTQGVYIIWHGGDAPAVVRVGSGNIGQKLKEHYNNMIIRRYEKRGQLMVTWAEVESHLSISGIENYLIELCRPIVSDIRPEAEPLPVRSPFLG